MPVRLLTVLQGDRAINTITALAATRDGEIRAGSTPQS